MITSSLNAVFDQTALTYHHAAALPDLVSQRLIERLQHLDNFSPRTILDLGCGTGFCTTVLQQHYPLAYVLGIDCSFPRLLEAKRANAKSLQYLQGDIQQLPFCLNQFDLICANFSFLWLDNLEKYLFQLQQWMKPSSLLLFTSLGSKTADALRQESLPYPYGFIDIHQVGDMLVKTNWQSIIVDIDNIITKHTNTQAFYQELTQMGWHTLFHQKDQERLMQDTSSEASDVMWEIIYGQAWRSREDNDVNENGEISIPIQQLYRRY